MKYLYKDYLDNSTFECEAMDVLAADKLYEAAGKRMLEGKKNKKSIPNDVTTWSEDWSSKWKVTTK
jgi:hypothetical protein